MTVQEYKTLRLNDDNIVNDGDEEELPGVDGAEPEEAAPGEEMPAGEDADLE